MINGWKTGHCDIQDRTAGLLIFMESDVDRDMVVTGTDLNNIFQEFDHGENGSSDFCLNWLHTPEDCQFWTLRNSVKKLIFLMFLLSYLHLKRNHAIQRYIYIYISMLTSLINIPTSFLFCFSFFIPVRTYLRSFRSILIFLKIFCYRQESTPLRQRV